MEVFAATAVAQRVALIILALAMIVGLRRECWAVIAKKPGWIVHLSTFIFTLLVVAGAIISSVNVFPDAGWHIPRALRLFVVNIGLGLFLVAVLTGLYRRALRAGPENARAAVLAGIALLIPGLGLVALLTSSGANG